MVGFKAFLSFLLSFMGLVFKDDESILGGFVENLSIFAHNLCYVK